MKWYWKVRIYRGDGQYAHCQVETERKLGDIDLIQDFYKTLTGCGMLLEGMSEQQFELIDIGEAFVKLWSNNE